MMGEGARARAWSLLAVVACCAFGFLGWRVWSSGGVRVGVPRSGGVVASRSVALGLGSLVVPGVQLLDGEQQALDAERAQRSSAVAFVARERSRTEFEGLGSVAVARVVRDAFPAVVEHSAAAPLPLPAGSHVVRYITPSAAQVALPGGKHAVVESDGVIARKVAPGRFLPLDLSLKRSGTRYVPAFSSVGVSIPERSTSGVALTGSGVSLTPADARGVALSGSRGVEDGAVVLYANTEIDTDTLVRPTERGFDLDAVLRSGASPRTLYFRVGMPGGAHLRRVPGGNLVHVLRGQAMVASIAAPYARDAAGAVVPVSMGVVGSDLLSVSVAMPSAGDEVQYPVVVDPEISEIDERVTSVKLPTNWRFETNPTSGSKFTSSGWTGESGLTVDATGQYASQEAGMLIYPLRPGTEAWIEKFSVETTTNLSGTSAVATVQLENASKQVENEEIFNTNFRRTSFGVQGKCRNEKSECSSRERGSAGNAARYALRATGAGSGASAVTERAFVYIDQEKGAELSYDSTHEYVDGGQRNVLYGGGGAWLGPNSGAFEIHAKDPGIGISYFGISGGGWGENSPILENGECVGAQCNPEFNKGFSYNSKMGNGEDELEATACDAAELPAECALVWPEKIKVDATLPYNLKLTGLPTGNEFSDDVKYTLGAEATDGKQPTPSSGIKSLALLLDGREVGNANGSCGPGECTAKAEWGLGFEAYGAGQHTLTLIATSNDGNVETDNVTITVRHASPIALGPGSVTPVTGEYGLTASDVTIGAPPSALTVRRAYTSRRPNGGASGPLGSPWTMSVGKEESLVIAPDGNVELVASSGQATAFKKSRSEGGKVEFESPKSDSNITLEGKEHESGKGVTEYFLRNVAQGTATKFTQPGGGGLQATPPTYVSSFGSEGSGTAQFKGPGGVAVDAKGDLWVVDQGNGRLEEFNERAEYLKTVATKGSGDDELLMPSGIAIDSKGNLWVADAETVASRSSTKKANFLPLLVTV